MAFSTVVTKSENEVEWCGVSNVHLTPKVRDACENEAICHIQVLRTSVKVIRDSQHFAHIPVFVESLKRYLDLKYFLSMDNRLFLLDSLIEMLPLIKNHESLGMTARMCVRLIGTRRKIIRLRHAGFTVRWRPLFGIVRKFFSFQKDRLVVVVGYDSVYVSVVQLIKRARAFFPPSTVVEILAEFRPLLCPDDTQYFLGIAYLTLFLPVVNDVWPVWLDEIMAYWNYFDNSAALDPSWISLLARLAKSQCGKVDWTPHLPFVFSRLLRSVNVPLGKDNAPVGRIEMEDDEAVRGLGIFRENSSDTIWKFGKFLLWSVQDDPKSEALSLILRILALFDPYLHPSNSGRWAGPLASLLLVISSNLCARIAEYRYCVRRWKKEGGANESELAEFRARADAIHLSQNVIDPLVQAIVSVALKAAFSKNSRVSNSATTAIRDCAYCSPVLVLPRLIECLPPALETLTATHQIEPLLRTFIVLTDCLFGSGGAFRGDLASQNTEVVLAEKEEEERVTSLRSLASFDGIVLTPHTTHRIGLRLLPVLLELTLPGVDPNDASKTTLTFRFYMSMFAHIPLSDGIPLPSNLVLPEESARCLPPDLFSGWVPRFLSRVFSLLETAGQGARRSGRVKDKVAAFHEVMGELALTNCLLVFFQQLDDDLYRRALSRVLAFVEDSFLPHAVSRISMLCHVCMFAHADIAVPQMVPMILSHLCEKNGGVVTKAGASDAEITYWLEVLSFTIHRAGGALLPFVDDVMQMCSLFLRLDEHAEEAIDRKVTKKAAFVLRVLLSALTHSWPKESRSAPSSVWKSSEFWDNPWNWSDSVTYKEANIEWHEPTDEMISTAVRVVHQFGTRAIDAIASIPPCAVPASPRVAPLREKDEKGSSGRHMGLLEAIDAVGVGEEADANGMEMEMEMAMDVDDEMMKTARSGERERKIIASEDSDSDTNGLARAVSMLSRIEREPKHVVEGEGPSIEKPTILPSRERLRAILSTIVNIFHGGSALFGEIDDTDSGENDVDIEDSQDVSSARESVLEDNPDLDDLWFSSPDLPGLVPLTTPIECGMLSVISGDERRRALSAVRCVLLRLRAEREDDVDSIVLAAKAIRVISTVRISPAEHVDALRRVFRSIKQASGNPLSVKHLPRSLHVRRALLWQLNRASNSALSPHRCLRIFVEVARECVSLSCYSYEKVRSAAQTTLLRLCRRMPSLYSRVVIPRLCQLLKDPSLSPEGVMGCCECLRASGMVKTLNRSMRLLADVLVALVSCHRVEKVSVHDAVRMTIGAIVVEFCPLPSSLRSAEAGATEPEVNAAVLINDFHRRWEESNRSSRARLTHNMLEVMKEAHVHWKYQIIATSLLVLTYAPGERPSAELLEWMTQCLVSDVVVLRSVARRSLAHLLQSMKRKIAKVDRRTPLTFIEGGTKSWIIEAADEVSHAQEGDISSEAEWNQAIFYDKNHLGFNGLPLVVKQYVYPCPPFEPQESNDVVYTRLCSESFRVDLIRSLTAEVDVEDPTFRQEVALLFNAFFQVYGPSIFHLFFEPLKSLLEKSGEDKERALVAAELFAGFGRGVKHWRFDDQNACWGLLSPHLIASWDACTLESVPVWQTAVRFVCADRDGKRLKWIRQCLFKMAFDGNAQLSGSSSVSQAKRLNVLSSMILEMSWRGAFLHSPLFSIILDSNACRFKMVRDSVVMILLSLLRNHFRPLRDPETHCPRIGCLFDESTVRIIDTFAERCEEFENRSRSGAVMSEEEQNEHGFLIHLMSSTFSASVSLGPCNAWLYPQLIKWVPHFFWELERSDSTVDQEIVKSVRRTLLWVQIVPFTVADCKKVVEIIHKLANDPKWHVRQAVCAFIRVFAFRHVFLLTNEQFEEIMEIVVKMLFDSKPEISSAAQGALAGLCQMTDEKVLVEKRTQFEKLASQPFRSKKGISKEDLTRRHVGVMGLSALVLSRPYDVPPWMPEVLVAIAHHVKDPHPIREGAMSCLKDFWRTHQDGWDVDKQKFLPEQLSMLTEMVVSPTYFS